MQPAPKRTMETNFGTVLAPQAQEESVQVVVAEAMRVLVVKQHKKGAGKRRVNSMQAAPHLGHRGGRPPGPGPGPPRHGGRTYAAAFRCIREKIIQPASERYSGFAPEILRQCLNNLEFGRPAADDASPVSKEEGKADRGGTSPGVGVQSQGCGRADAKVRNELTVQAWKCCMDISRACDSTPETGTRKTVRTPVCRTGWRRCSTSTRAKDSASCRLVRFMGLLLTETARVTSHAEERSSCRVKWKRSGGGSSLDVPSGVFS